MTTTKKQNITFEVSLDVRPEFCGRVGAFAFDSAGNLLEKSELKSGKISFDINEKNLVKSRLFIAPIPDQNDKGSVSIKMMERIGGFEAPIAVNGKLIDTIFIPGTIIDAWPLCFCWVRGQVIQNDSGLPICKAKVHICEVDKIWWWIWKLPEPDIFRLRDDLLNLFKKPDIRSPVPRPDPAPFFDDSFINTDFAKVNPRPQPSLQASSIDSRRLPDLKQAIPFNTHTALLSPSVNMVRKTLADNFQLLMPYFCLWPWWRLRCDEIIAVETDSNGRFSTVISYKCSGDKPDLYFWVEYKVNSNFETVYRPPVTCNTYWNYTCGTEVTLRINDERVPACDGDIDLPGSKIQILSIGRTVSISEINGAGASFSEEGLTTLNQPFGGRLEPRVWFSRTTLRDDKNIHYYRWSYRRLTSGNGSSFSALPSPGAWQPLKRTVIRHYAKENTNGDVTHEPYVLGPRSVGAESNLFEIKPADIKSIDPAGIEWTVVDEREDLASGHFETGSLGEGSHTHEKALDAAGKYELKLELFKADGSLVNWTTEELDLEVTNVPAPFGTETVTAVNASNYNRIQIAGDTMAFRMVLRIDNNRCNAEVAPVSGTDSCGFIEYDTGASITMGFKARHPNNFATLSFSVVRGVSNNVAIASTSGQVGTASLPTNNTPPPAHAYNLSGSENYTETFAVVDLMGGCDRAAFAERIYVSAMATDGYTRLGSLDKNAIDGFALAKPCP